MTFSETDRSAPRKPLRLWPGVVAVALLWLVRFVVPVFAPDALEYCVLFSIVGALIVILWWAFFSRAPGLERWGAIALMILGLAATLRLVDASIRTGMMGFMLYFYALPVLCLALVGWAVASRNLSDGPRRVTMVVVMLLACAGFTLIRTGGMTGEAVSDFAWRWAPTAEDRLVAHASDKVTLAPPAPVVPESVEPVAMPVAPVAAKISKPAVATKTGADWPGFRGPDRNDSVPGVRIETNWVQSPPVQMWRRPVGPGWSSFAVRGDLFYTQEQRGGDEVVSCYRVTTGEPVWKHGDPARFWESNAGAGPRATPTLYNGRVYTFGATGILNALNAATGAVVWSRSAGADAGRKVPEWGFASSPLVVDGIVIVAAAGKLAAYDASTGEPRWLGPDGEYGYSSPHLLTIDGVTQVLLMSGPGATSVSPVDGKKLWEYPLPANARIVQPAVIGDGDVLVSEGEGHGMRRISVTHGAAPGTAGWTVAERWATIGLKPYFSDFVVHKGYAYGFDGGILSSIDLKDGKRKWKGGRYGSGQLVLLSDQDLLLVLSEEGELVLVAALPDQFKELARFPAIEGKTWNHPVLAGNTLLVRNGQEMAAFSLAIPARP